MVEWLCILLVRAGGGLLLFAAKDCTVVQSKKFWRRTTEMSPILPECFSCFLFVLKEGIYTFD